MSYACEAEILHFFLIRIKSKTFPYKKNNFVPVCVSCDYNPDVSDCAFVNVAEYSGMSKIYNLFQKHILINTSWVYMEPHILLRTGLKA